MPAKQFRLPIGAKRQVTLPAELLEQLQVSERGELQIEVIGDVAVMTPMVSVPRSELPEELRRRFESRRGAQPSDIPLAQFLKEIGYEATADQAAPGPRPSARERLAGLTKNEEALMASDLLAEVLNPPFGVRRPALTEREQKVLQQAALGKSLRQIARELGMSVAAVDDDLLHIQEKLGNRSTTTGDQVRSTDRQGASKTASGTATGAIRKAHP